MSPVSPLTHQPHNLPSHVAILSETRFLSAETNKRQTYDQMCPTRRDTDHDIQTTVSSARSNDVGTVAG